MKNVLIPAALCHPDHCTVFPMRTFCKERDGFCASTQRVVAVTLRFHLKWYCKHHTFQRSQLFPSHLPPSFLRNLRGQIWTLTFVSLYLLSANRRRLLMKRWRIHLAARSNCVWEEEKDGKSNRCIFFLVNIIKVRDTQTQILTFRKIKPPCMFYDVLTTSSVYVNTLSMTLTLYLTHYLGARIVMACRDLERAEEARLDILEDTGNENVVIRKLDLSDIRSIRAFAGLINKGASPRDSLVNGAHSSFMLLKQQTRLPSLLFTCIHQQFPVFVFDPHFRGEASERPDKQRGRHDVSLLQDFWWLRNAVGG